MSDMIRERIVKVLAGFIAGQVQARFDSRRNFRYFRAAHPSTNQRSGQQTIELPLQDCEEIAERATKLLKDSGYDITVKYDSRVSNRAFVAKLR